MYHIFCYIYKEHKGLTVSQTVTASIMGSVFFNFLFNVHTYFYMNDAFWSDYNTFDKKVEFFDADRISIIQNQEQTETHTSVRFVMYDDEWGAIRKPTKKPTMNPTVLPTEIPTSSPSNYPSLAPTHHPTKRPKRQQKPTKTDEQILAEYQKQSNVASKNTQPHIVKLFSLYSSYSEDAMTDLEIHLIRDKQADKILIDNILPYHPISDKTQATNTEIDWIFGYIYEFFGAILQPEITSERLCNLLVRTVAGFKTLSPQLNTSFHTIIDSLSNEYKNHSNAMQLCSDLAKMYEGGPGNEQDPIMEGAVLSLNIAFFIKSFDKIFALKMHELDQLCTPKSYPMAIKHVITECMHQNQNISKRIDSVFDELVLIFAFVRHRHMSILEMQNVLGVFVQKLYRLISKIVWIKEDFQIMSIIKDWINTHRTSTIYIVSDLIDHPMLESLLLYFDDIKYEKYSAHALGGKGMKKKYRMVSIPLLNITKQVKALKDTKRKSSKQRDRVEHVVKLFSVMNYTEDAMVELESDLIRENQHYDKIMIADKLFQHPKSNKIATYKTKIDLLFVDIYQFFYVVNHPEVKDSDWYEVFAKTVLELRQMGAMMNSTFYDLYSVLFDSYRNDTYALNLCHDMRVLYEDRWSTDATKDYPVDCSVISFILDFFLNLFERILTVKVEELNEICGSNHRFPVTMNRMIDEQKNKNGKIFEEIKRIIRECKGYSKVLRHANFSLVSVEMMFEPLMRPLHVVISELVQVKADFEAMNLINQWIQERKSESLTVFILSDLMHHRVLETLLLYFEDIRFEKYYAQTLPNKMKKKYLMTPVPKLNVTKCLGSKQKKKRNKQTTGGII